MSKPLAIWFEFSAKYANRLNITFRDMDQTDFFMAEKKNNCGSISVDSAVKLQKLFCPVGIFFVTA